MMLLESKRLFLKRSAKSLNSFGNKLKRSLPPNSPNSIPTKRQQEAKKHFPLFCNQQNPKGPLPASHVPVPVNARDRKRLFVCSSQSHATQRCLFCFTMCFQHKSICFSFYIQRPSSGMWV